MIHFLTIKYNPEANVLQDGQEHCNAWSALRSSDLLALSSTKLSACCMALATCKGSKGFGGGGGGSSRLLGMRLMLYLHRGSTAHSNNNVNPDVLSALRCRYQVNFPHSIASDFWGLCWSLASLLKTSWRNMMQNLGARLKYTEQYTLQYYHCKLLTWVQALQCHACIQA